MSYIFLIDADGRAIDFGAPYVDTVEWQVSQYSSDAITGVLPRNRAAFEVAAATALGDILPVPIRTIVDPDRTPMAFLPFLASHESVDLWFEDWPEARKRAMVREAPVLATLKGTRQGSIRFLSYVDGAIIDIIAFPAPFVIGRAVIGRTPINQPAFVARYLVKIVTYKPPRAFVVGRSVIGRDLLKTPSRDRLDRGLIALRAAKAPDTEIRVDFAYRRQLRISDGPYLDGTYAIGDWLDLESPRAPPGTIFLADENGVPWTDRDGAYLVEQI